jgi:hypothetical protein
MRKNSLILSLATLLLLEMVVLKESAGADSTCSTDCGNDVRVFCSGYLCMAGPGGCESTDKNGKTIESHGCGGDGRRIYYA